MKLNIKNINIKNIKNPGATRVLMVSGPAYKKSVKNWYFKLNSSSFGARLYKFENDF